MDRALRLAFIEACLPIADIGRIDQALAGPAADRAALVAELDERDWRGALSQLEEDEDPLEELRFHEGSLLWCLLSPADRERLVSLEGIAEVASGLQALDLSLAAGDLRPLTGLEQLSVLRIRALPGLDLGPLVDCGSLERLRLEGLSPDAAQREVLNALEQRGVAVDWPADIHALAAPFGDPMLKLAVLDVLVEAGAVTVPELTPIDEFRLDEGNLARLLTLPMPPDALASIEELTWAGGGYNVMHRVWPQFDGETDELVIRSLSGLEALPGLESVSISPLRAVPPGEIEAVRRRGVSVGESDPSLDDLPREHDDTMLREMGIEPPRE